MNWKIKQRNWKSSLVMKGIKQKDFCEKYNISEVSFSKWVSCAARANPENELRMDTIIESLNNDNK